MSNPNKKQKTQKTDDRLEEVKTAVKKALSSVSEEDQGNLTFHVVRASTTYIRKVISTGYIFSAVFETSTNVFDCPMNIALRHDGDRKYYLKNKTTIREEKFPKQIYDDVRKFLPLPELATSKKKFITFLNLLNFYSRYIDSSSFLWDEHGFRLHYPATRASSQDPGLNKETVNGWSRKALSWMDEFVGNATVSDFNEQFNFLEESLPKIQDDMPPEDKKKSLLDLYVRYKDLVHSSNPENKGKYILLLAFQGLDPSFSCSKKIEELSNGKGMIPAQNQKELRDNCRVLALRKEEGIGDVYTVSNATCEKRCANHFQCDFTKKEMINMLKYWSSEREKNKAKSWFDEIILDYMYMPTVN